MSSEDEKKRLMESQRRAAAMSREHREREYAFAGEVRAVLADLKRSDRTMAVEDLLRAQNAAHALMISMYFRDTLERADAYERELGERNGRH